MFPGIVAHSTKVVVIATRTLPAYPNDRSLSTRVTHYVLMLVTWEMGGRY